MSEQVATGGLKSFDYGKNVELKLDEERKRDIKEGYNRYYRRKLKEKKQRKRNWIILLVILLIIFVLVAIWLYN